MLLSAPFVCVSGCSSARAKAEELIFHVTQVGYIMYLATMDAQVRFAASFMVAIGAFSFGSYKLCLRCQLREAHLIRSQALSATPGRLRMLHPTRPVLLLSARSLPLATAAD